MQRLKPQNKKTGRLRKAALLLALAGATLIAGYSGVKCGRAGKPPAPIAETIQRAPKVPEPKAREAMAKLEKALSAAQKAKAGAGKEKAGVGPKEDAVLMRFMDEFPYQGLDCKLLPWQNEQRPWNFEKMEDADELLWNDLKDAPSTATEGLGNEYHSGAGGKLLCRLGMLPIDECPTDLTEEIQRFKESKNLSGLLSVVDYLNDLNIEWERGVGDYVQYLPIAPPDADESDNPHHNLFSVYLNAYSQASQNGWETAPSLACVAKNAYALRLLRLAEIAIGDIIIENGGIAGQVLERLPDFQRLDMLMQLAGILIFSEDSSIDSARAFLSALSPSDRTRFVEAMSLFYSGGEEKDIARMEALADLVHDPQFSDSMRKLAREWKKKLAEEDRMAEEMARGLEETSNGFERDMGGFEKDVNEAVGETTGEAEKAFEEIFKENE